MVNVAIFRSDEGVTDVGSLRGFRTVMLYDEEIQVALDLRRFVLRRFTVTNILKRPKNIKRNKNF